MDRAKLGHTEIIPHADQKIGIPRRDVPESPCVESRVMHLRTLRMGVALHGKSEVTSGRSLRMKPALLTVGIVRVTLQSGVETIEVLGVGFEVS